MSGRIESNKTDQKEINPIAVGGENRIPTIGSVLLLINPDVWLNVRKIMDTNMEILSGIIFIFSLNRLNPDCHGSTLFHWIATNTLDYVELMGIKFYALIRPYFWGADIKSGRQKTLEYIVLILSKMVFAIRLAVKLRPRGVFLARLESRLSPFFM